MIYRTFPEEKRLCKEEEEQEERQKIVLLQDETCPHHENDTSHLIWVLQLLFPPPKPHYFLVFVLEFPSLEDLTQLGAEKRVPKFWLCSAKRAKLAPEVCKKQPPKLCVSPDSC